MWRVYWVFRLCGGYMEAIWRVLWYLGYMEGILVFRVIGGYAEAMRRLCGGYVEGILVFRVIGGYAEAMRRVFWYLG
jgi:hypothetical protein